MNTGEYDNQKERPYGSDDDEKSYKIVSGQLSNRELLRADRRVKNGVRLFPKEAIFSRGRIINPQQFIVAVKINPRARIGISSIDWTVGNTFWLTNERGGTRTQVEVVKSRQCSLKGKPEGTRYVLLQTVVGKQRINQLEGQEIPIFNADKGGNPIGIIHGGGSNQSGGQEHSGGQSNCYGAALLVRPLPDPESEIDGSGQLGSRGKAEEIIVAVLDSGILGADKGDKSMTCSDPKQFGWNFVDDTPFPFDDHLALHGTKVSTIIRNYAPNARILPVKVADEHGVLDLYDVLCGLEYARTHGANVVNASWSFSGGKNNTEETDFPLLLGAIRDLDESGVMVVAAAGNKSQYVPEANGEIAKNNAPKIYPACYTAIQCNVITVTTVVRAEDEFKPFENFSSRFVDTGVVPLLPATPPPVSLGAFIIAGFRGRYEGSSFATPIVTARVANVLSDLTGFASKRTILRRLSGFHEENDLANEIRDGGCYIAE